MNLLTFNKMGTIAIHPCDICPTTESPEMFAEFIIPIIYAKILHLEIV